MKQVNIYTMTSLKGTKEQDGRIAYVLELKTEKEPVTLSKDASVLALKPNLAELKVTIEALKRMREKCELVIYTESAYIPGAYEAGWVNQWKKNNWMNAKGKEIAHKEEWIELDELLGRHLYTFKIKEEHEYRRWLMAEVRKER